MLNGGLLIATVVLSIKTGFILASSRLNAAKIVLTAFGFGSALMTLTVIFSGHHKLLAQILDKYTFSGAISVSLVLIYLGLQESAPNYPGPSFEPTGCDTRKNRIRENKTGYLKNLLGFLPCPLCTAALAFSVLVIAPVVGTSVLTLGSYTAVLFFVFVSVTALISRKIISALKWQPGVLFDRLLFFSGLITLSFALMIPNFVQAMTIPDSPIKIDSPILLASALILFFLLASLGFMIERIKYSNYAKSYSKGSERR